MITCREFVEFVWAYLADELPREQKFEFDAHLAVCPHCVVYLDTYKKTASLGREAFFDPEAQIPVDVPDELVDAILAAKEKDEE